MTNFLLVPTLASAIVILTPAGAGAQPPAGQQTPAAATAASTTAAPAANLPKGYVIGPEDILTVTFWREKDLTADVVVRPDGKISLPVLNDMQAAGLTPEQLAKDVETAAAKYLNEARVTVIVKEIHSRKVFVVGEVGKPGSIQLGSDMTVLQVLAEAGGLLEHARRSGIAIVRNENGQERRFTFNYNDAVKGKRPEQNIKLQPGDTVIVR